MDPVGLAWAALIAGRGAAETVGWMDELAVLDDARSAAFVRADVSLLDDVYVVGAVERAEDARTVRAYASRGLEVEQVRFDLLRFRVERRSGARVVLRVVEQLQPVRVRRPGGAWRLLPRDGPTERRLVLRATAAGWRIASVERLAG